ncbi:MAG: class I SAM-dependent methyltransferase [Acidobacteria bacterium]|nr:class I SAM-dependent methyltransferase [Acidobacteriota bacterium]
MLRLVAEEIEKYAQMHTEPVDPLLNELEQYTHAHIAMPQMLVGPLEGALLRLLVTLTGARHVLEIGTFTGYSSLAMASAMPEDGTLITCELDPSIAETARSFHRRAAYGNRIEVRVGPALDTLSQLKGPFDMCFIDADKVNYSNYFHRVLPLLCQNGLMVADNTLWSGRVTHPADQHDESTRAIHTFNQMVARHPQVTSVMLPIRDGMTLIRKK